jgi:hypothetical protein
VDDIDDYSDEEKIEHPIDLFANQAFEDVKKLFADYPERVFYGRQIEIILEDKYFHWVTNRALRDLAAQRAIGTEVKSFAWGGSITLYWNNSYRYYKREAKKVIELVEKYSQDKISLAVGQYGELLVVEGFSKIQFVNFGRSVNKHKGKSWTASSHNLDMIVERDGIGYGIEVKNTLGYIGQKRIYCEDFSL